jgi:hypothetical protein
MFVIASMGANENSLSRCQDYHPLTSSAGRALQMNIRFSFKERVIAPGALALVCLTPILACARIPGGLPDFPTAKDAVQSAPLARNSEQSPQAGGQQDPNSQPGSVTANRLASKPPKITYDEDGQLTIVAENSPLSEVMSALRAAIGADIDLPPSIARQRIWVRLGPGPARKVLRDLLDNTELDYVIQASDSDPDGIKSVLLTLRTKAGEAGVNGSRVARVTNRKNPATGSSPSEEPDQDSPAPVESATVSDPAPAAPLSPTAEAQSAASSGQPSAGVPESSSSRSEQMIQQLQSMYQQRRQMQTQQNQKPPSNNN